MVPLTVPPIVIVQATDVRPLPADAPALRASLLALNDKAIAFGAEVLDLAVPQVEGLTRVAESLLQQLASLRKLLDLGVHLRAGCLALRQD